MYRVRILSVFIFASVSLYGESGIKKHLKGEYFAKLFLYTKNKNNGYFDRVFPDKKLEALRDELTFQIDKLTRRNAIGLNKCERQVIKPACFLGMALGLFATELKFLSDLSNDPSEGALPFLIIPIAIIAFTCEALINAKPCIKKYSKLDKLVTIEKYVHKLLLEKDDEAPTQEPRIC